MASVASFVKTGSVSECALSAVNAGEFFVKVDTNDVYRKIDSATSMNIRKVLSDTNLSHDNIAESLSADCIVRKLNSATFSYVTM